MAVAVALLAVVAPGARAQTAPVVQGTVVDALTGTGVAGAHVAALRTGDFSLAGGAVAGADGAYTIDGLSPGPYFLYAIDAGGTHVAGFHGAPAVVTVSATGAVRADPALAPRTGRIAGAVTEDGTGAPVPGAWVAVLSGATASLEAGTVADATGAYSVDGLAPGPHFVVTLDPTGAHRPEFHDDSPGPGGASTVTVAAGATTEVATALTAQPPPPPPTASLHGTVAEMGTGAPITEAWVVALDAATMQVVGGARTGADGAYSVGLAAGRYVLEFVDPTGAHAMEWYDDQDRTGLGRATPVDVDGATVVDETLAPATGTLSGTLREDASTDPVGGAWVLGIGPSDVRATTASSDGTWRLSGLAPGTYRVAFVDAQGGRGVEYWDGSADYTGAAPVTVAAGSDTEVQGSLTPLQCGNPDAPVPCLPAFPTPAPGPGWSRYTIATGTHSATVVRGAQATAPLAAFTSVAGRRFHFLFDATAKYVLTNPTQPEDQFDWNKLPGLSDCPVNGIPNVDLSQNGWMFGWRWRTDLAPRRLEVTAYANNNGVHLTPPTPMVTLTEAQVDAGVPLWFELAISADHQRYEFRVAGPGSRSATASLPRQCPSASTTALKWASGFYFGGTSTAPNLITGSINEP